jgi:hypothetical protein
MPLFVQLEDHGEPLWHAVESFETVDGATGSSHEFKRSFKCGCGLIKVASADRLLESENPPWTNRHVAKGCFKTAADKLTA